jgi:hypothetical protein
MLRCASSCSAVDKQRTSRERSCDKSICYSRQNSNFGRVASFEPGGRRFESVRAHFITKKYFGGPGHLAANEQFEPPTDNKTVRQPGAAPGWTSPLQRRRSGAQRRTRGRRPRSNPSGRAIQISLKAPNKRLDRQLRRASYIAIRQLSNVRTAPQVTTLEALLLPTPPKVFYPIRRFHNGWCATDSLVAYQNARISLVAIDICDQPEVSAT